MGQINIEGVGLVEIAGDEPTTEELQSIESFIKSQQTPEQQLIQQEEGNAVIEFFKENLDIPGGIAGAYTGFKTVSKYSPIKHPILLGAGGIIGGALGVFFGSANSSKYKTGEVDYDKALKDASISVGFDIATLGIFKALKPVYNALKTNRKAYSPPELPKDVGAAGTQESLRRTQSFLEEGGGSLLPSQTNRASKTREIGETIASVGLLSRRRIDDIAKANSETITKEIQKQIDGINPNFIKGSSEELGGDLMDIIREGKKLNQLNFENGLARITEQYGNVKVPINNIVRSMEDFVAEASKDGINTLNKNTLRVIEKTKNNLIGSQLGLSTGRTILLPDASVNKLIAFQKEINKAVNEAANFNSATYSNSVERELTQFSSKLKESIDASLNVANKNLSKDYRAVNKVYSETLNSLLPKINKTIVTKADNGNYHALGNLLLANNNVSQINNMMKSIDTAFNLAKKQNLPLDTTVKSAAEAKQMVRQSYLKKFFGEVEGDFDPNKYFTKFSKIDKNPNEIAKLKAILGNEGFNNFKRLSNAVLESSKQPGQDMFSLAVRSRETTAGLGIASGAVAVSDLGSGLLIFLAPEVIGRIAVNKRAVNKLLTLNNQIKKSDVGIGKALTVANINKATASILEELPEYDKEAIKFYMGADPTKQQND